ncbi:DedA family protein [Streptomyces sp. NPDC008079]|uniref:DedA family protein n=1 Tax=Streptomyces sp. NPDC008079 TaxID=3364806 RepID=UPI0036EE13C6
MDVALNVSSLDFTSGLAEYLRGGHVFWAYAVLALTTAPPLVPNSVLLVTGGVMAAEGRLDIALVLLVVAGSAVLGDMLIHRTGRALSGRVLARMERNERRAALLRWAALRIQRHGVPFVIGVRFLPSGRVIGGLAAGVVRYPARRYAVGAGVAEAVWASYSVGAGYFSGKAASNSFFALCLGLGISMLVAGIGTLVQWVSRARERRDPRMVGEREAPRPPSMVVRASFAGDAVAVPGPSGGGGTGPAGGLPAGPGAAATTTSTSVTGATVARTSPPPGKDRGGFPCFSAGRGK